MLYREKSHNFVVRFFSSIKNWAAVFSWNCQFEKVLFFDEKDEKGTI